MLSFFGFEAFEFIHQSPVECSIFEKTFALICPLFGCHGFFWVIDHAFNDDTPGDEFTNSSFSGNSIEFIFSNWIRCLSCCSCLMSSSNLPKNPNSYSGVYLQKCRVIRPTKKLGLSDHQTGSTSQSTEAKNRVSTPIQIQNLFLSLSKEGRTLCKLCLLCDNPSGLWGGRWARPLAEGSVYLKVALKATKRL